MTPSERDRERARAWLGQQPHVGRHDWTDRAWCTACVDSLAAFRAAARREAMEEAVRLAEVEGERYLLNDYPCHQDACRWLANAIRALAEKENH